MTSEIEFLGLKKMVIGWMVIGKFTIDELCMNYCIRTITNSWRNLANNTHDPAMLFMIPETHPACRLV